MNLVFFTNSSVAFGFDALRELLARVALKIADKFSPKKIGVQWERLLEQTIRKECV
ncbi:MAG: hypothetical protein ACI4P3_04420 [Candidatus Spyradosoma sp.]